ncbi:MAG: hypothetical protein BWK80_45505 [Desulfobacteraceae bacterium IS3]|nr:MAG: hypothetical protein BWK80_45505 [Desulfobacteraceae bacterium IS3]
MKKESVSKKINISADVLICFLLVAAIAAVYGQTGQYDFVTYDDGEYVYENIHVKAGLTWESIVWAFTTTHMSNWHPLTWLSYMLEVQIYGPSFSADAGLHHLGNVLFHIINSLLLFSVLKKMTGALWQSAFVAALFALHPLHVESVAWISERKDVLSMFFWLLTMWGYARYVESPEKYNYLITLLFFMAGLMSKPMVVTLPFVLILLDFWPLKRLKKSFTSIFYEKIPFFVLTAILSAVTFFAQKSESAVGTLSVLPLDGRIANALVSYISYIVKMILPYGLSVFYPHPFTFPIWQVAGAAVLLIAISAFVFRNLRQKPYLAVGWLWYIGTLVPVIGLVQVGSQSMADRYTYIPLIGLFIIIAHGIPDILPARRYKKTGLALFAAVIISILMIMTETQAGYWKNSFTLFQHALAVTSDNYIAHRCVGDELFHQGKTDEAIRHYQEALRISPNYANAYNNLGAALFHKGKTDEAIVCLEEALRLKPDFAGAHKNLAQILPLRAKRDAEIAKIQNEFQDNPNQPELYCKIGNVYKSYGQWDKAVEQYRKALSVQPEFTEALNLTAIVYAAMGKYDDALSLLKKSLRIQPDNPDVCYYIACVFARQQQTQDAVFWLKAAVRNGFENRNLLKADDNLKNIRNTEYYKQLIAD